MPVHRLPKHKRGFLVVAAETINDERLSYAALGYLIWMIDKPEEWDFASIRSTRKVRRGEGRDGVRSFRKELKETGYMFELRQRDELGRIRTITHVAERPELLDHLRKASSETTGDGAPGPGQHRSRTNRSRRTRRRSTRPLSKDVGSQYGDSKNVKSTTTGITKKVPEKTRARQEHHELAAKKADYTKFKANLLRRYPNLSDALVREQYEKSGGFW